MVGNIFYNHRQFSTSRTIPLNRFFNYRCNCVLQSTQLKISLPLYCLPSCNPTWKEPKPRIDVCPAEVQRKCPNTFLLWACSSVSETSLLLVWGTTPGRTGLGWSLEAWVSDTGSSPLLTSWPLVVVCTWFLGNMPTRGDISQSLYLIIWLWLCFSSQILCLLSCYSDLDGIF